MKTSLFRHENQEWLIHPDSDKTIRTEIQLVLCFGERELLKKDNIYHSLKNQFTNAEIVITSTAGEIYGHSATEHSVIAVAITFSKTLVRTAQVNIADYINSAEAAEELMNKIDKKDLAYVMVLSDGGLVNGSEVVKALNRATPAGTLITGGMAGDGSDFKTTVVGLNETAQPGNIAAIGFYGDSLYVSYGSRGGWEKFGLEKIVTRSDGNRLMEIDHNNALDLYKKYLGPEAALLPQSALLFPLSVSLPGAATPVVRTILSIDEGKKTMVFAGDVPEGSKIRFMKANLDKVIMASAAAASESLNLKTQKPDFALLISCVGRKLVLGPRTEEEIEAVAEIFGNETLMAGFYSYGEIAPSAGQIDCHLHNQTMTITSFYEIP